MYVHIPLPKARNYMLFTRVKGVKTVFPNFRIADGVLKKYGFMPYLSHLKEEKKCYLEQENW